MNALSIALKTAGVKTPPQTQRIWTFLHDSPRALVGIPSKEIGKTLGIGNSSVSSLLSDMARRGMVTYTADGNLRRYKAVGAEYELRPLAAGKPAAAVTVVPVAAPAKIDLDSLTVREARELYNQLKRMFS